MLEGGVPRDRIVLIIGGPGTGKTILCTQFLVSGIENGETGVFVSLDERKEHFFREMSAFSWDLEKLEKAKKLIFVDASPIRELPEEKLGTLSVKERDFSLVNLIDRIKVARNSVGAKRISVDALASMTFKYPSLIQLRMVVLDLVEALTNMEATCFITTEQRETRGIHTEEYLAHGVIRLQTAQVGKDLKRSIQVVKMRDTKSDLQPHPFDITQSGIKVYAKEPLL